MRNSSDLISVLVPAYNCERFCGKAIESILNQRNSCIEVLICNDGSEDNTADVIRNYLNDKRIKYIENSANKGKVYTVNRLASMAKGKYITIHDADDISHPTRFYKTVKLMNSDPSIRMVGCSIQRMNESGELLENYKMKEEEYSLIRSYIAQQNNDGDATMVIRRNVLENVGGLYRSYFESGMDYDLALRIIENYKVSNVREVLYYYRNVGAGLSKRLFSSDRIIKLGMAREFHKQRIARGYDDLMVKNWDSIRQLEDKLKQPYLEDPSLGHRRIAEYLSYCKMHKASLRSSMKAIQADPFNVKNWRLIQHCIRKFLIGV